MCICNVLHDVSSPYNLSCARCASLLGGRQQYSFDIIHTSYGFHCTNNTPTQKVKSFASSRITLLLDRGDGSMKIDLCVIF